MQVNLDSPATITAQKRFIEQLIEDQQERVARSEASRTRSQAEAWERDQRYCDGMRAGLKLIFEA